MTDTLAPSLRSIELGSFRLSWSDERPLSLAGGPLRDGVAVEPAPQVESQGFHLGQLGHAVILGSGWAEPHVTPG